MLTLKLGAFCSAYNPFREGLDTAAYAFFPTWMYFYHDPASDAFIAGLTSLYPAVEWILARLVVGLGVAGGLCVVAMVFDGLLQRRLAPWKYLYATARDALSGGPPLE